MKVKPPRKQLGTSERDVLLRVATALFNEQCAIAILANLPERIDSEQRRIKVEELATKSKSELRAFVEILRYKRRLNAKSLRNQTGSEAHLGVTDN